MRRRGNRNEEEREGNKNEEGDMKTRRIRENNRNEEGEEEARSAKIKIHLFAVHL